ncbi:uncharacterized protein LOC117336443 [Pecten maximus]|uniref:uncharacterized protein LOC117336443 n=1 Tax=Pecten maximus TaxID=6579 RepID=UPI0014590C56|nr:uncharacterized protein LOC117336443 [Pecten maximus]
MSDEVVGTWIATAPAGESKGFEQFCKTLKADEKMIEQFRKVTFGTKLSKEGSSWTVSVLGDENVIKTVSFESGKEYETEGMDKKMYKVTSKMDGCKCDETSIPMEGDGKGTRTTRVVNNGVMTVTSTSIEFPDCSMTYTMKKK